MNIKGKFNISNSILIGLFSLVTIVLTVLRCIDVNSNIDSITGFYINKNNFGAASIAVIVISFVVFFVLSILSSSSNNLNLDYKKSSKGYGSFVLSLGLLLDLIINIFFINKPSDDIQDDNSLRIIALTAIFGVLFQVLSIIYFVILGVNQFSNKNNIKKHKILALSPVVYGIIKLVGLFVTKISFLRVSDLFLQIISFVLMTLFFMSFAQCNSEIYSEGNTWKLFAYGISCASVLIISNIPKLIYMIIDSSKINASYPISIAGIAIAIFIVDFLFSKRIEIKQSEDI